MISVIRELIAAVRQGAPVDSRGRRLSRHRPQRRHRGIAQPGPVERACPSRRRLGEALKADGIDAPVIALNDADALAAGIAATRGVMEKLVRVWYLGDGIGFGRYPRGEGVWEGGHTVVSLDPKERYCGCGGAGHLEGIMGQPRHAPALPRHGAGGGFRRRAGGRPAPAEFRQACGIARWPPPPPPASTWTVPAASTWPVPTPITSIPRLLGMYLQEMVKMSPLQGSFFEIVPDQPRPGSDRRCRVRRDAVRRGSTSPFANHRVSAEALGFIRTSTDEARAPAQTPRFQ